jgi:hypothetical protein
MSPNKILDHLIRYEVLYVAFVALILGAILGAWIRMAVHHCPKCPQCPELVARSHIEREIVGPQPDMVRVVKRPPAISAVITPSRDTTQRSIVTWGMVDTMPDKAVIGVAVSSGWLPTPIPKDLAFDVKYLAVPERIKIINDTLTVQLPALKCPSRLSREIVICGIGVGVGVGATVAYFTLK